MGQQNFPGFYINRHCPDRLFFSNSGKKEMKGQSNRPEVQGPPPSEPPPVSRGGVLDLGVALASLGACGALLGYTCGQVPELDFWKKAAGAVFWAVIGALLGTTQPAAGMWHGRRFKAVISWAIGTPIAVGILEVIVWMTGGWEGGLASTVLGGFIGVILGLIIWGIAEVLKSRAS